jgi:hypothetical protein
MLQGTNQKEEEASAPEAVLPVTEAEASSVGTVTRVDGGCAGSGSRWCICIAGNSEKPYLLAEVDKVTLKSHGDEAFSEESP